ncbi:erythrocyte binding protein [Marssonina coronariae]|uniref:Erythrocyte binding protein n=1 Tax=Diplocarpon coronariae TaxID=2795749 RepID=A0A218ZJ03_9HELO|nr:erythrocyte binding protein [Marssonina coronariae]
MTPMFSSRVEEGIKAFHMRTVYALGGPLAPPSRDPSSYRHLLPRLFGIIPITAPDTMNATNFPNCIGSTSWKECGMCNNEMASGKGIDSTIVELACSPIGHVFHIRCIFEYWDAPGKLLHSCPTCGHMAQLNWETVGLKPFDCVDFAHNNQSYYLSSVVAPYLSDPDPIKRAAARKLYNAPGDIADDFDAVSPEAASVPYFTRAYYARENKLRLAKENMAIFWRPVLFPAGQTATLSRGVRDLSIRSDNTLLQSIYDLNLSPRQRARIARAQFLGSVDALAKRLGRDFMRLASERQDRAVQEGIARGETVTEQNIYDMSEVRILPTARMAPQVEAWQFRSARRRRDAEQRRKVKLARRGLAGLGS